MDFGPLDIVIQVPDIDTDASTDFEVGNYAPEIKVSKGPVGDPQIIRSLLL
jgi:hypothetical protein